MKLRYAFEKNAGTITTSATGAGTVNATKLQQVAYAHLDAPGYVITVTSISGQAISFQVKQSAGTTSALANPTAAVSFDPGTISILEYGY